MFDITTAYGGAASVLRNVSLSGRVVTIADSWLNNRASVARFQFATTTNATVLGGARGVVLADTGSGATMLVSAISGGGSAITWSVSLLDLPAPQTSLYGGEPVYFVAAEVAASAGALAVVFTPGG
jgi:hypothetical protein